MSEITEIEKFKIQLVEDSYDKLFKFLHEKKIEISDEYHDLSHHDNCKEVCGERAFYVTLIQHYRKDYDEIVESVKLDIDNVAIEFEHSTLQESIEVRDRLQDLGKEVGEVFVRGVKEGWKKVRSEIQSLSDEIELRFDASF